MIALDIEPGGVPGVVDDRTPCDVEIAREPVALVVVPAPPFRCVRRARTRQGGRCRERLSWLESKDGRLVVDAAGHSDPIPEGKASIRSRQEPLQATRSRMPGHRVLLGRPGTAPGRSDGR